MDREKVDKLNDNQLKFLMNMKLNGETLENLNEMMDCFIETNRIKSQKQLEGEKTKRVIERRKKNKRKNNVSN